MNLSRHSLWGAAHTAGHSGLCCAAQIPWLQDKLTKFPREHLLEWSCFLLRKLYKYTEEQKGDLLSMARSCTALCSVPWGNPFRPCSMLHECRASNTWWDLLATCIPPLILSCQSGYPIKPFVVGPFFLTSGKSCALSLSLSPHPTIPTRNQNWNNEIGGSCKNKTYKIC